MRRPLYALALALLLGFTVPGVAQGWSYKEHILLTRLAVQRLLADANTPPEMKTWLREIAPTAGDEESARRFLVEAFVGADPQGLSRLDFWVCFPDMARKVDGNVPVAPFGVPEPPMHFIDLELLVPGDAVKQYQHDLSKRPRFEDIPRDWRDPRLVQAGYLPWRVEQIYGELVKAIAEDRLLPVDEKDRNNAMVLAGYLAHYLGDNTQPQHATIDFRSHAYFAIGQRAPDVHGMVEWGMVDWEGKPFPELRQKLWESMAARLKEHDELASGDGQVEPRRMDPWRSTLRVSFAAYEALPLIGQAAQAAAGQGVRDGDPTQPVDAPARAQDAFDIEGFFAYRGLVAGREMSVMDVKGRQMALSVLRIEGMLRQAWREARPDKAR